MTQRVVNYTYGTGNPVLPDGSIDVRDGIDNLQSLDVFMNAQEDEYNQRDGVISPTVRGAIKALGPVPVDFTFTTGGTFTSRNQAAKNPPDGNWYGWGGDGLPHVVAPGTDPALPGSGYVPRTDVLLRNELASGSGSGLVRYQPVGTGAVSATVQSKLREFVSVKDFGAVGDGITDDTAAFSAACASLGAKGGTVRYFDKHLIDLNLTIPPSVTLKGPVSQVGSPGTNASYPYGNMAALIVNSLRTITLSGGAGLDGCLIYRKGMVFPAVDTSLYAGTAITAGGDDVFAFGCLVMGFNQAFYSTFYQRPRLRNFLHDNINGIWIDNCADVPYLDSCHAWPFATVGNGGPSTTNRRAGYAYRFSTLGDWNKITNCFAYGYANGFGIADCNSVTLLNCGTDSTGGYTGQIGFTISGSSNDTRLIGCQAAAQDTGYRVTGTGTHTRFTDCDSWSCTGHGVLLDSPVGDVTIIGGIHRDVNRGITVNNTGGRLVADLVRFYGITTAPFSFLVGNDANCLIGPNCDYGNFPAGSSVIDNPTNKVPVVVASANPLLLPPTGELYQILGTTGFSAVKSGWTGRKVVLAFSGVLTVTSTPGLLLAGNFTTAEGSTLSLIHNGTSWFETGRKA